MQGNKSVHPISAFRLTAVNHVFLRAKKTPMKAIKGIHTAIHERDALNTWRVMPAGPVTMHTLEPFIFLNHHGPVVFPPNNDGLPFGPHPHKGFETVTFIVDGSLVHRDSTGFESEINKGGIQWMTAGAGIIHSETSSPEFLRDGGNLKILQLWVNLPAALKETPPAYTGLQASEIPVMTTDEGRVQLQLISGTWLGQDGALQSTSDVQLSLARMESGAQLSFSIPEERQVLCYVIQGTAMINGRPIDTHQLVVFGSSGMDIDIKADEQALILLGHARPNNEPIAAYGPFVMNTHQELQQAFADYQAGKFGQWPHG